MEIKGSQFGVEHYLEIELSTPVLVDTITVTTLFVYIHAEMVDRVVNGVIALPQRTTVAVSTFYSVMGDETVVDMATTVVKPIDGLQELRGVLSDREYANVSSTVNQYEQKLWRATI